MEINKLQDIVSQTRRDILRMVHKVNSGNPGGSLGCIEFLVGSVAFGIPFIFGFLKLTKNEY
jgi:transketolase N-terminal domain/subunit